MREDGHVPPDAVIQDGEGRVGRDEEVVEEAHVVGREQGRA